VEKDNVQQLMGLLPEGYEAASRETGAMRRKSGVIKTAHDLMWLVITHLVQKSSLLQASALSEIKGIGKISDVAFMKRLANCCEWFKWILGSLVSAGVANYLKPYGLEKYRLLAVDASEVTAANQRYRLHFALDLLSLASRQIKLTTEKVGESLVNFKVSAGDLFIGDRAYGTKRSIEHCLSGGGDFILRLRHNAFQMLDETGAKLDLLKILQGSKTELPLEIPVWVDFGGDRGKVQMRVCALHKSPENVAKAMERIEKTGKRKQQEVSDECKELNEYIILITSLPQTVSTESVLSVYRYRWQIELYFKRLKSLMSFGEVPKKKPKNIEAWLNGKMVVALLIEIQLSKLDFSPIG
jgi:hypothetical protein